MWSQSWLSRKALLNRNTLILCRTHTASAIRQLGFHTGCAQLRGPGPVGYTYFLVICFVLHGFSIYQLLSSGFFPLEAKGVLVESLKGAPLACFLTYLELCQDAEGIPTHTYTTFTYILSMLDVFLLKDLQAMANASPLLFPSRQPTPKFTDISFKPPAGFWPGPRGHLNASSLSAVWQEHLFSLFSF